MHIFPPGLRVTADYCGLPSTLLCIPPPEYLITHSRTQTCQMQSHGAASESLKGRSHPGMDLSLVPWFPGPRTLDPSELMLSRIAQMRPTKAKARKVQH